MILLACARQHDVLATFPGLLIFRAWVPRFIAFICTIWGTSLDREATAEINRTLCMFFSISGVRAVLFRLLFLCVRSSMFVWSFLADTPSDTSLIRLCAHFKAHPMSTSGWYLDNVRNAMHVYTQFCRCLRENVYFPLLLWERRVKRFTHTHTSLVLLLTMRMKFFINNSFGSFSRSARVLMLIWTECVRFIREYGAPYNSVGRKSTEDRRMCEVRTRKKTELRRTFCRFRY